MAEELLKSTEAMSAQGRVEFKEASEKLIKILKEKGSEVLIQNIDLIRRYTNGTVASAVENVTMSQE